MARVESEPSSEWGPFILCHYSFAAFSENAVVLDIGCGFGAQLRQLTDAGCVTTGVDVAMNQLRDCRKAELRVVQARAEALPIRTAALDGVICKVALPYTIERLAIAEL